MITGPEASWNFLYSYMSSKPLQYSCCCLFTQSCLTFCESMDCTMPGFQVIHHLPKLAQIHVHWVNDTIQPSHPLSSASPLAFNLSQNQVAKSPLAFNLSQNHVGNGDFSIFDQLSMCQSALSIIWHIKIYIRKIYMSSAPTDKQMNEPNNSMIDHTRSNLVSFVFTNGNH